MSLDISGEELKKNCPLDGNCDWKFLYRTTYNYYDLPIHKCETCGLQTIYPNKYDLKAMYSEGYYKGTANYSYLDERKNEKYESFVWDARLRNVKKFKSSGKLLDIGSAFGGFLNRAKLAGFEPYGIEISEYSAQYANERGIPTFNGSILDADFPASTFDVITLIEVIEHLDKPELVFQKLSQLLKPGGLLLIQTANFDGLQAQKEGPKYHYYLPGHLFYYSSANMKKILTKNGFKNYHVYHGVDFPLYAKLLKSMGSFRGILDYFKWFRISYYHLKSKFFRGSTSSMVLYAFK
jgi:2-polyprenyl-3-methyl-5-hydroxy-6-metoxy-1,4-benzoquinol methylase